MLNYYFNYLRTVMLTRFLLNYRVFPYCTLLFYTVIKDCGPLPNPPNGVVSVGSTIEGSKVNYSCITGYNLMGDSMRICTSSGNWSGNEPLCESKNPV